MCRKIKKLAWCVESKDPWEKTMGYRFLELLVVRESESAISDRIKKAGMTTEKYDDYFLDQLRPLLQTPNKYLAPHLKKAFHPDIKEEKIDPELAALIEALQKPVMKTKPVPPRPRSVPAPRSEDWVMVTPVPHIRCPCYPKRTYRPVVTEEEKMAVDMQKTELAYQMQTLRIRRERQLQSSLDHYLPGYLRAATLPRPHSVPSVPNAVTREVRQGIHAYKRLSTPRKRLPLQSPCHAAACDAYQQGVAPRETLGKVGGSRMLQRTKSKHP